MLDFESPPSIAHKVHYTISRKFHFGTSQFEFSIKSYVRLKFFRPKFLKPKIYDKSIQCKNSTIKYILNQVVDKKIWVKNNFLNIFNNFTKLLTSCKEKRQGVSNQGFTVEKGSHIKCKSSLQTCNVKKLANHLCQKMLQKVDEGNKGTNQMSVIGSENTKKTLEKLSGIARKTQIMKAKY